MANYGSDAYLMPPFALSESAMQDTDAARSQRYRTYLDFYNGLQWSEKRKPGERRLSVNYARTFVQKGVSYLMGKPVKVELVASGGVSDELASETEKRLLEIWDANGLASVDYDTAIDAAVLGDGAFKVTLQPGKPDPLRAAGYEPGAGGRVVVRPVDASNLSAAWRGDDMRSLLWVKERYSITAGEARERFNARVLGQKKLSYASKKDSDIVQVCEYWNDVAWSVEVAGQEVHAGKNPYGFIPYVIFPNLSRPKQFWGLSDLEDIMTLNSEFNVRVSILSQLLQMSGNPVLVLENVDSAEGLRVGPGAIWTLPEGAKATLLEMLKDGGVQLHLSYIELLYKMMHDLAELPGAGFGRDQAGSAAGSGVALEILLYPVVQKINRKRRIWDEVLDLRNRMMLALAGLPVLNSRIVWPDVLPKDRSGLVTQEVGLVAANIHSLETARRALGDEQPDEENQTILDERSKLGLAVTPTSPAKSGIQPPVKLSGSLVEGLSNSGG